VQAWWGSAEPIAVTNVDQSPQQRYAGTVHHIFFEDIRARSEAGIVLYSGTICIFLFPALIFSCLFFFFLCRFSFLVEIGFGFCWFRL
jgi:hypothetical protein